MVQPLICLWLIGTAAARAGSFSGQPPGPADRGAAGVQSGTALRELRGLIDGDAAAVRPRIAAAVIDGPADAVARKARRIGVIASLGPTSFDPEAIRDIVKAGAVGLRLNLAHMGEEDTRERAGAVSQALRSLGRSQRIPILYDLPGGKVRTGMEPAGGAVSLAEGRPFTLFYGAPPAVTTAEAATVDYPDLGPYVRPGSPVRIYQGKLELTVVRTAPGRLETTVVRGGALRGHATVEFPGVELPYPRLRGEDRNKLEIAVANGADWIGVSMVQRPDQMDAIRAELVRLGAARTKVVAKIETLSALDNLDAIVRRSDLVMIAGGDLSAATGTRAALESAERKIADAAARLGKPLIAATIYEGPDAAAKAARAAAFGADFVMLEGTTLAPDPAGVVKDYEAALRAAAAAGNGAFSSSP